MCREARCSTLGKGTWSALQWKHRKPCAFWESVNNGPPPHLKAKDHMDLVHHGFHRKYIRLLFLFRMKTAAVFLFQDYKGDVRDCEKLQGTQTDVGGHHCALRKTRGVMAEVAAEPYPSLSSQRRHGRMTLHLPAPLHQGCPNGLLWPWRVPRLSYGAWGSF